MRLPRTDLVPVLTIAAGGIIGASLSFTLLGPRSDDVPVVVPVVVPSATDAREQIEPLETVPYRINFLTSAEMTTAITQLISDRGQVAEAQAANTVIVTDIRRVHDAIGQLIGELDIPTPQIMISAKIIFRTDLEAPGVNGFYTRRGFLAEDVEQKPIR